MPLKNRQTSIPNGLTFLQPETGWRPRRYSSFNSVVDQLIAHRRGNPHLIQKNGWSVDRKTVEAEVDNYNTKHCIQMGWTEFVEGGGPLPTPFTQRASAPLPKLSLTEKLVNVAEGSAALVDFIDSKEQAVPAEQANSRAATCAVCPLNHPGDWLSYFTAPVAGAIRRRLQQRRNMQLSTPHDDQLGVCGACDCPLPLMIHFPLETKLKHLSDKARLSLHENCWVRSEEKAKINP